MKRVVGVAAWAALAWLALLWRLGSFGLAGPDEPRYAAIAAGMLRHKDWITPRLWGSPWFEKPVLYYWLAGLSQGVTHVGAAAARRPNAILAVILCAAMALFLRREHSARAGWLAGFMGLSSAFVIGLGRAATTDMTLTVPLTLALLAGYMWWQRRGAVTLAWAAVALAFAVLAKGPVAVALAALILIPFAATQRRLRDVWQLARPLPLALFFIIAAPWYIALELRQPEFFRVFFLQHNLERFATNKFEHPQAWWFYLPVLLLAVFPWTGWLLLPLQSAARRLRHRGWGGFRDGRDAALKFYLGLWVLATAADDEVDDQGNHQRVY
ncbi:MAG: glycosyltransferase family 39 protein, partial [Terriglobales bacterium]